MRFFFKLTLFVASFLLAGQFLSAQETAAPQQYHVHDYFAVPAGGAADYLAMEKVWKKIHQANIKSGKYLYWELTQIVVPVGSSAGYNYVTRIMVEGEEDLAAIMTGDIFAEAPAKFLTEEEMAIYSKTGAMRTHVHQEVYTVAHELPAADWKEVKVAVHNHFDFPETGSRSAHVQTEKDIWGPIHAARIKEGKMLAWVVAARILPWGADEPFHDVTVDLYKDLPSYLANRSPMPYFPTVHPGKDVDELLAQTNAAATLVSSEVRLILDSSNTP